MYVNAWDDAADYKTLWKLAVDYKTLCKLAVPSRGSGQIKALLCSVCYRLLWFPIDGCTFFVAVPVCVVCWLLAVGEGMCWR